MKKRRLICLISFVCFLAILCSGCSEETSRCVKCGGVATTILSGSKEIIKQNGISIVDCEEITESVYSAAMCESCIGTHVVSADQWD
jgi:hypothetical protein